MTLLSLSEFIKFVFEVHWAYWINIYVYWNQLTLWNRGKLVQVIDEIFCMRRKRGMKKNCKNTPPGSMMIISSSLVHIFFILVLGEGVWFVKEFVKWKI